MATERKVPLCGLLVSKAVREAAFADWPVRPDVGFDDRTWAAACANHVLGVAREHGEEPGVAALTRE